jgi:2-dehydro-3-deoxyphosphogluconate aldolase / (4S)-4-hydroxy-2-oxoglutarate aldolase
MRRSKSEIVEWLLDPGIIAVVRAQRPEQVLPLSEALLAGGVRAIEITTTTPNAIAAIAQAQTELGNRGLFGIGTVLDVATCRAALEAGAEFVVSPIGLRELVPLTQAAGKPVMLGAYTPTEAQAVHESGADFVKIFPAETLGPAYIKALRAPLPHLRIVPTGGVEPNNVADFLKAGCVALGAGGSLVSATILEKADWPELTRRAAAFVAAARSAR